MEKKMINYLLKNRNFKNFLKNKDKKTTVIKGSDDTVKHLSLYILEKYRNKNIKTIGRNKRDFVYSKPKLL